MRLNIIIYLCISLLFILPGKVLSQDVSKLLKEAESLESSRRETEALKKYQEIIRIQPGHITSLCKASELLSIIGGRQTEKAAKINHYKTARRYAETALKVNPKSADANFVMSVAMGRLALVLNGQDKIDAVSDIKRYAEQAVRLDPDNYKAYHVLGKWHFEVSSLNAFERIGVKLLFGGFPPSSFAESIRWYEKSRSLDPSFALNYLEVAKAYIRNGQRQKAVEVLKRLQSIPPKTADDPRIKAEGAALLSKIKV